MQMRKKRHIFEILAKIKNSILWQYLQIFLKYQKNVKLKCTVHLCNRVYKVADLAKKADTRGVNMKNSLFKKEMKKVSERPVIQRKSKK